MKKIWHSRDVVLAFEMSNLISRITKHVRSSAHWISSLIQIKWLLLSFGFCNPRKVYFLEGCTYFCNKTSREFCGSNAELLMCLLFREGKTPVCLKIGKLLQDLIFLDSKTGLPCFIMLFQT